MSDRHPHLTAALTALADARPAYEEAESFYDGEVDEVIASRKLRELLGDQAQKYRINYARTPVDVLLERTAIQGWTCSQPAQLAAIDQTWDDNELGIEAKDVHRRAYEYGDAFLIAWPDEELPGGVEVYAHGPAHVRVFYDPERPRRKSHAVHDWNEAGSDENGLGAGVWHRVNLYYPDRVEQWVSRSPVVNAKADDDYVPHDDPNGTGAWPLDNPTPGIIPVFHFRTGRPYGRPEHADAFGPQRALNKLLLSLMGAVDHQVLPQRYVATESVVDAPGTPGGRDPFEEATGELTTTSTTDDGLNAGSTMETGPGNVWLLSGRNVRPGQFEPASSANFIVPMESLIQQMADVTDMPADRYRRGGQSPSGDSKRMDEVPLNKKAGDRHDQFGVTWHEFAQYVCIVADLGETDAQVAWEPPETYSDLASWQTALVQLQAGVPFDQVMRERGYNPDVIAEWERLRAVVSAPVPEGIED